MANPVTALAHTLRTAEVPPQLATPEFRSALSAIVDAAGDPVLLGRYRRALASAEAATGACSATPLLQLVELLLSPPAVAADADAAALATLVRKKAHAERVFQALSAGPLAQTGLEAAVGLAAMQVRRVLSWGMDAHLIHRLGQGRAVAYGLTRLGELALRGIAEPAWLQRAALAARITTGGRLRRKPPQAVGQQLQVLAGWSEHEAEMVAKTFAYACDPAPSSALAAALGASFATTRPVVVLGGEVSAAIGMCVGATVERAGLTPEVVQGDSLKRAFSPRLAAICVGKTPLGDWLLRQFDEPVQVREGEVRIRLRPGREHDRHRQRDRGYGVISRMYAPSNGASHFVIQGLDTAALLAAVRTFDREVEGWLDAAPSTSFVVLVGEGASRYQKFTLHTIDPFQNRAGPGGLNRSSRSAAAGSRPRKLARSAAGPFGAIPLKSRAMGDPQGADLPRGANELDCSERD